MHQGQRLSDAWTDDEDPGAGQLEHSRNTVLRQLHDSALFDWLDDEAVRTVALLARDSMPALGVSASLSCRLNGLVRELIAKLKEPVKLLRRSEYNPGI